MKVKHLTSGLLMCLLATSVAASGIYKWTDENGNVHFTQTPPPKKTAKRIGNNISSASETQVKAIGACTTLSQQLVGDWRGKDRDQRIVFRLYEKRNVFEGEKTDKTYFIDYGRQGQLQGGFWHVVGTEVIFRIKKIGGAAKKRPTIKKAMVAKIDPNHLYLLVGDEEFRLRRYLMAGNTPSCFRKKHR